MNSELILGHPHILPLPFNSLQNRLTVTVIGPSRFCLLMLALELSQQFTYTHSSQKEDKVSDKNLLTSA